MLIVSMFMRRFRSVRSEEKKKEKRDWDEKIRQLIVEEREWKWKTSKLCKSNCWWMRKKKVKWIDGRQFVLDCSFESGARSDRDSHPSKKKKQSCQLRLCREVALNPIKNASEHRKNLP